MSKSTPAGGDGDGRLQWLDKLGMTRKPRAADASVLTTDDDSDKTVTVRYDTPVAFDVNESCRNSLLQSVRYVPINFRDVLSGTPAAHPGVSSNGCAKRGREIYADDEHGAVKFAWIRRLKKFRARQPPEALLPKQSEHLHLQTSPHQPSERAIQIERASHGVVQHVQIDQNLKTTNSVSRRVEAISQSHLQSSSVGRYDLSPSDMTPLQPFSKAGTFRESPDSHAPSPGDEVMRVQQLFITDRRASQSDAAMRQHSLPAIESIDLEQGEEDLQMSLIGLGAMSSATEHGLTGHGDAVGAYAMPMPRQAQNQHASQGLNDRRNYGQKAPSIGEPTDDMATNTPFYAPGSPSSQDHDQQWSYAGAGQYRSQGRQSAGRRGAQNQPKQSGGVMGPHVRIEKPTQPSNSRPPAPATVEPGRRRKAPRPRKGPSFACPFSKHDPQRYAHVFTPCTYPPGLEPKRVTEHVRRCHSLKFKGGCLYCKYKWNNEDQWWEEFQSHTCPIRGDEDQVNSNPEPMGQEQERVLAELQLRACSTSVERWKRLYRALFPDSQHVPEPDYDYYVRNSRPALFLPEMGPPITMASNPYQAVGSSGLGAPLTEGGFAFPPWMNTGGYDATGFSMQGNDGSLRSAAMGFAQYQARGADIQAGLSAPAGLDQTDDEEYGDDDEDEDDEADENQL